MSEKKEDILYYIVTGFFAMLFVVPITFVIIWLAWIFIGAVVGASEF